MNARVSEYAGTCAALALRASRGSRARQVGAEYDDLYQEGMINVWQTLQRGVTPSIEIIELRMRDWIKHLDPQVPGDYDQLLPLDDLRLGGAD